MPLALISSPEVDAGTYLREHNYNMAALGKLYAEFRVIIVRGPRYVQTSPLLRDTPLGPEETSSVEGLILADEVFIRDPKHLQLSAILAKRGRDQITYPIITKLMSQKLHPFRCPLLRTITPGARPLFNPPRITRTYQYLFRLVLDDLSVFSTGQGQASRP